MQFLERIDFTHEARHVKELLYEAITYHRLATYESLRYDKGIMPNLLQRHKADFLLSFKEYVDVKELNEYESLTHRLDPRGFNYKLTFNLPLIHDKQIRDLRNELSQAQRESVLFQSCLEAGKRKLAVYKKITWILKWIDPGGYELVK